MTTVAPTRTQTVIAIRKLNMVYRGRGTETVALKDANLEISEGEFISLIGPSGCGKTDAAETHRRPHRADFG